MQSLNTHGLGSESVLVSRLAPTLHQLAPGPVTVGEVRKRRLALNWPRGQLRARGEPQEASLGEPEPAAGCSQELEIRAFSSSVPMVPRTRYSRATTVYAPLPFFLKIPMNN